MPAEIADIEAFMANRYPEDLFENRMCQIADFNTIAIGGVMWS